MADALVTSLGRVQPLYKGQYIHGTRYSLLDNVFYEGSTYISLVDDNINHYPTDSNYWQIVASQGQRGVQGYTGSFGTPVASASILNPGTNPTVNITATGPDEAKVFNFQFGIPAGPYGFDDIEATATRLASDQQIAVDANLDTSGAERVLKFDFGIPAADGQGAQSVDGIMADGQNNVNLSALRYVVQNLSEAQKKIVRSNINGMEEPATKIQGAFVQYGGTEENPVWVTVPIEGISSAAIDTIIDE